MTSSRRSFLKLFGTGAAAIVVAPHVGVPETDAVEASAPVVEPQKLAKCTESHDFDPNFQSSWIGISDGPVMVTCGIRCIRIPAGFTVAEIRENLAPYFRLSSDDEAWKGLIKLNDDYVVNDGYFEFIRMRVKEKGI